MKYISYSRSILLIFLAILPLFGFAEPQPQYVAQPLPGECEDAIRDRDDDGPDLKIADFAAIISNPVFIAIEQAVNTHQTSNVVSLLSSPKSKDLVHNPSFVLLTARLLARVGMHTSVLKLADVALKDFPDDRRLKYIKLKALFKLKKYRAVAEYARENPEMDGAWERQWVLASYIKWQKFDDARAYALETFSDPALQTASHRLKDRLLTLAFRMPANQADPSFKITILTFGLNHSDKPDYWGIRLAHLLSRFHRPKEAMAVLEKVIALHPVTDPWWSTSDYHAKQRTVFILMDNKRYEEALDFADLITSPTDHALLQAQIFNRTGDHEQALIVTSGHQFGPMMWERAIAYTKTYRDPEAYRVLNDLLHRTAGSPTAGEYVYKVAGFMLKLEKSDASISRSSYLDLTLESMSNAELDRVRSEQNALEAN